MGRGFKSFCPCQKTEVARLRFCFLLAESAGLSPAVLRRLGNIVVAYRLRKPAALPSPYFLRARRRKQLSTVSYSLTRRFDQIRNSRLIQSYRPTVFFLSLNISLKSLIYKGFFAFVVHFGICGAYILCLGYLKIQKSTTPRQGVVPSYR